MTAVVATPVVRGWAAAGTAVAVRAVIARTHPVMAACLRGIGLSSTSTVLKKEGENAAHHRLIALRGQVEILIQPTPVTATEAGRHADDFR
ncbi:hypothetical protein GCM10018952_68080 [Streptosporangium vulgare]